MNKYNRLIKTISEEFNIPRGITEEENSWKCRVIYSVLGRMAYAALYDITEDLQPASVIHIKKRIRDTLRSYITLYPEIKLMFDVNYKIEDEIYDLFLNTGQMYHSPNRVVPARPSLAKCSSVYLTRGMSPTRTEKVSGLGSYNYDNRCGMEPIQVQDMFQLQKTDLSSLWKNTISNVQWVLPSLEEPAEYLRMKPPFSSGYWTYVPEEDVVSLCRMKNLEGYIYYLYKKQQDLLLLSPIPSWKTEKSRVRLLANACLCFVDMLPSTTFHIDGELVKLSINYLYGPSELNFIKLYSWPDSFVSLPHDFNRKITASVFFAIKPVFESMGYSFTEV